MLFYHYIYIGTQFSHNKHMSLKWKTDAGFSRATLSWNKHENDMSVNCKECCQMTIHEIWKISSKWKDWSYDSQFKYDNLKSSHKDLPASAEACIAINSALQAFA